MTDGEWTIDALRAHIDQRFADTTLAVQAALAAQEKAVSVAESNAEKWRANANEWRGAMTDREQQFVHRAEYDALVVEVARQRQWRERSEGRGAGAQSVVGYVFGAAGFVSAVAAVVVVLAR